MAHFKLIKYTLEENETEIGGKYYNLLQNGKSAWCKYNGLGCASTCADFELIPKESRVLLKGDGNEPVIINADSVQLHCTGRIIALGVEK